MECAQGYRLYFSILFAVLAGHLASQATLYVISTGIDSGDCNSPGSACATISYALEHAVTDDTIFIGPGVYTEPDGLVIENSVAITGAGSDSTILQAHQEYEMARSRVVTIDSGLNVLITGMTIRHGVGNGDFPNRIGGGLHCRGSSLIVNNVNFSRNVADEGGAVQVSESSISFSNVVIDSNYAEGSSGGAMSLRNSYCTMDSLHFANNRTSILGLGGGIISRFSALSISNSWFISNQSTYGGAICAIYGSIDLDHVFVIGNRATIHQGGGVSLSDLVSVMNDVLIENNYSGLLGGGVSISRGTHHFTRVTIRNNTASIGGGVHNHWGELIFSEVSIDSNFAYSQGGGMYYRAEYPHTFSGVAFRHNEARNYGGGLTIADGDLILKDLVFFNNKARHGGGLDVGQTSPLIMDVVFEKNIGGGLYNFGGSPKLSFVTFTENQGGGMFSDGSFSVLAAPVLRNVLFKENAGRGMTCGPFASVVLHDVVFEGNISDVGAGFSNWGTSRLYNSTFLGNMARLGGAIYNVGDSISVVNSLFEGNEALEAGGAFYNSGDRYDDALLQLINCTVSGNSAGYGGAIYNADNAHSEILNSILWGNSGEDGHEIFNDSLSTASLNYSLSRTEEPYVRSGSGFIWSDCLDDDPLFADVIAGDYRLLEYSPVIDNGDPSTLPQFFHGDPANPLDLDSLPRFVGAHIDIGAYEWQGFVNMPVVQSNSDIVVFPNPASHWLYVESNEQIRRIVIIDVHGKVVLESTVGSESIAHVNVKNLCEGIYALAITTVNESIRSTKFLKND